MPFSDYGLGAKYFLGGNILDPRSDSYVFPGLNESELTVNQFIKLNMGVQYRAMNKIYITPHIVIASVGFNDFSDYRKEAFSAKGKWQDAAEASILVSAGTKFSYNSIFGPINFDVSWVNSTNKVRFFIGVGFQFNRSN